MFVKMRRIRDNLRVMVAEREFKGKTDAGFGSGHRKFMENRLSVSRAISKRTTRPTLRISQSRKRASRVMSADLIRTATLGVIGSAQKRLALGIHSSTVSANLQP